VVVVLAVVVVVVVLGPVMRLLVWLSFTSMAKMVVLVEVQQLLLSVLPVVAEELALPVTMLFWMLVPVMVGLVFLQVSRGQVLPMVVVAVAVVITRLLPAQAVLVSVATVVRVMALQVLRLPRQTGVLVAVVLVEPQAVQVVPVLWLWG